MPFSTRAIRKDRAYYNGTIVQPSIQERRGVPACPTIHLPIRDQDEYDFVYPTVSPRYLPTAPAIPCVGLPFDSPGLTIPPPATPHRTPRRSRGLHWPSARLSPSRLTTPKLGPFEFLRQLHSGTFGSAVFARDLSSGRGLCLKIVDKRRVVPGSKELKALQTELQAYQVIADSAPCRFVMDCHGVFQDGGSVYFAMDHLRSDMHSLLAEKINPRRMKRWIAQMALGISALHDMGIIHRDIKPENVLVDRRDNIRIFDYGTAYIHHKPVRRGRKYSHELVGTRQYLAPEYLSGKSYGPTVDYWALGCTVFDLIAGDILFANDDKLWEYLEWDAAEEGMSYFRWRRPKLSDVEVDLLSGLLNIDPRTRYTLDELHSHPYFFDSKGRNVFDEVLREAAADTYATVPPPLDLPGPTAASVIFTPIHYFYDPYCGDFNQFGWINHRGIWSDHTSQGN